jgi:hypothetical protein
VLTQTGRRIAHVLGAFVLVVTVVGAFASGHAAGSTLTARAAAPGTAVAPYGTIASAPTGARRLAATHEAQSQHKHKATDVAHDNLPVQ